MNGFDVGVDVGFVVGVDKIFSETEIIKTMMMGTRIMALSTL